MRMAVFSRSDPPAGEVVKVGFGSRLWENGVASTAALNGSGHGRVHADLGAQARIACSSGPIPMIAITRFML
jgi:hypothetical protein